MKVLFGYLFLIMAGLLTIIQAAIFPTSINIDGGRLFLLFILTIGSIIGAGLVMSVDEKEPERKLAAAAAFLICIALIARIAFLVLINSGATDGWEYTLLVIYGCAFGIYGFNAFSL